MEALRLTQIACTELERFSLYLPTHTVTVREDPPAVSYSSAKRWERIDATYFDFNVVDSVCYLSGFGIEQVKRRKKHGTELYRLVENIAREIGCEYVHVDPSGQGKLFWPELGFSSARDGGLEKKI